MYEYDVILPENREELFPKNKFELDSMLEYNTDNYYVDRRHVVFSVDGNSAVRNEALDPYFKIFVDCTVSLSRITKKNKIYRVFFKRPVYTSHTGPGTTPPTMNQQDIRLMLDSFVMVIDSKLVPGTKRFLWEELKAAANKVMKSNLIFHELPEREPTETEESYAKKLQAEIERIQKETSMYWNIKYDGKR